MARVFNMLGADRVMWEQWRGKWKLPFEGLGSRDIFSQSWRIKSTRTCKITWKLCCCSHCILNFESPHKQDNISRPKKAEDPAVDTTNPKLLTPNPKTLNPKL